MNKLAEKLREAWLRKGDFSGRMKLRKRSNLRIMLRTRCTGSVKKPPLLFLHGFLGSSEDWNEVIEYLKEHYYCITCDLPGHGSPLTEDFPKMVQETLEHLGLTKAALVGYSMGGRLAMQAAQALPKQFSSLIAISAHPGLRSEKEQTNRLNEDLTWERLLKTRPLGEFLDAWYAQPLFHSLKKRGDLFEKIRQRRLQHEASALSAALRLYGLGHQRAMRDFSKSTFFLCGEEDEKYHELYKRLVPKNQLFTLKNCGHALHLENPEACANMINNLLEKGA